MNNEQRLQKFCLTEKYSLKPNGFVIPFLLVVVCYRKLEGYELLKNMKVNYKWFQQAKNMRLSKHKVTCLVQMEVLPFGVPSVTSGSRCLK